MVNPAFGNAAVMKTVCPFPKNILGALFVFAALLAPISQAVENARILIRNHGSDSMVIAVSAWSEEYQKIEENVGVTVSGGGSGAGIAAFINGLTDIACVSRAMTARETELARKAGREPLQTIAGRDAIAIYAHKNNPLASISMAQLGGIFGRGGKIEHWSDLGVEIPGCDGQAMVPVSRQNSSGTYTWFRKNAIGKKYRNKFRTGTLNMQSSKDVTEFVSKTPCAIGYSSFAYAIPAVKTVCLSQYSGTDCKMPSINNIVDNSYPMSRPLYLYTDGQPQGVIKRYIDWVLSDAGQCILLSKQYAPIRDVECD